MRCKWVGVVPMKGQQMGRASGAVTTGYPSATVIACGAA